MGDSEHEPDPRVSIINDVPSLPRVTRDGPGTFSDLFSSNSSSPAPVVCGIWTADDVENGVEHWPQEYDEVKYVLTGESIWEDVHTGKRFTASPGSMIWLPKGAQTRIVWAQNLSTIYVEQSFRQSVAARQLESSWISRLQILHDQAICAYTEGNPASRAHYESALNYLPGGNTRSVLAYSPFPLALASGSGCRVTSLDGHGYLDLVSEYSAAFFGHSNEAILAGVQRAGRKGLNLGGANPDEVELAIQLVNRFPSIDKIRFCNSGTEANILATCLGLAFTRRKQVLGFNNGYHGAFTHFGSAGNSLNIPFEYAVGQYNVTSPNDRLLSEDIGVIILEPMQGAGGMLPASKGFLQWARHAADRIGAVLVFDEIITSRLHIGGLQTHFDVYPDLTTLGKYVGGGFGFGACGGRADIMALLNPGGLFHSGTYNNDTFTMAAGVEAGKLLTRDKIAKANDLGDILRDGINNIAKRYEQSHLVDSTGFGSCVGIHFSGPVPTLLKDAFFFYMLQHKVYVGKRGFLSINLCHKQKDVTDVLSVVDCFFSKVFIGK